MKMLGIKVEPIQNKRYMDLSDKEIMDEKQLMWFGNMVQYTNTKNWKPSSQAV